MIRFWNFYKCSNLQTECGECKSKMEFSFSFLSNKILQSFNQSKQEFWWEPNFTIKILSKWICANIHENSFLRRYFSETLFLQLCALIFFIIDMGNKDTCMLHNIRHIIFRTSNTCWMNSPAWTVAWAGGYYLDFLITLLDCF